VNVCKTIMLTHNLHQLTRKCVAKVNTNQQYTPFWEFQTGQIVLQVPTTKRSFK